MAKKSKKKSTIVSVNMKGVEGKGQRVKPGEYLGEVEEASLEDGDKAQYIKWTFALDDGGKAWFNTSLAKNSLWNLRGLLEAMGEEVPNNEMDIDLEEMVGKRVGIVMEEETWEGKKRTKMVDYFSEDDHDSSPADDDDKKDDKKSKKSKKSKDKLSKEDVEGKDRDELLELNSEHDLELDEDDYKDNAKGNKKLLADVLEKLDEKDLLGEEAKEEDAGDKKKGKKSKDKIARDTVEDADQDELADIIKDNKLDVDLDDYKKLKDMTKAVIKALEEEGLLED